MDDSTGRSVLASDPVTFEVVKNALYAAAEEMKVVLAKTAYSPILKVAGDYSCGVFDAHGQMVAQGPDLPIHLGSMPDAVRAVVASFDAFAPGDMFIHNDPYFGGRSEEHTSELQSLMRISYAVFCLKKKTKDKNN